VNEPPLPVVVVDDVLLLVLVPVLLVVDGMPLVVLLVAPPELDVLVVEEVPPPFPPVPKLVFGQPTSSTAINPSGNASALLDALFDCIMRSSPRAQTRLAGGFRISRSS
jgi:hypothetical protein